MTSGEATLPGAGQPCCLKHGKKTEQIRVWRGVHGITLATTLVSVAYVGHAALFQFTSRIIATKNAKSYTLCAMHRGRRVAVAGVFGAPNVCSLQKGIGVAVGEEDQGYEAPIVPQVLERIACVFGLSAAQFVQAARTGGSGLAELQMQMQAVALLQEFGKITDPPARQRCINYVRGVAKEFLFHKS
ncbi:hypothetical protein [Methylobacterium fujisawaense]|uniref:hypothetical protein n=1 Tax=Methylobacterium fujisawaense TaxID=107400 RepID=UPI002F35F9B1